MGKKSQLAAALAMTLNTGPAAAEVCGWYAIAACTSSRADAVRFANRGWGAIIDTDDFRGFRGGLYCVVSGPQSKASAERDRKAAVSQGIAADAYIKRACADESVIGD